MPPVGPVSAAAELAAVATELVVWFHRSARTTVGRRQSYLSKCRCWTAVRWWWMNWPLSVAAVVLVWISVVVLAVCYLSD